MGTNETPREGRIPTTALAALAAALSLAAIILAVVYFAGGWDRGPAPGPTVVVADPSQTTSSATAESSRAAASSTSTARSSTSSSTSITIAPSTTDTTRPPALTVAAGGDVLGDRGVGRFIDQEGSEAVFADVAPALQSADIAFVNLESPVSDMGTRNSAKEYTFRSRPALIDGMVAAGIDVVGMANNHVLDYGPKALADTIERLDRAGIAHAGAGANKAAAATPALLAAPAGIVAVLAFTEIVPGGFAATGKSPGVQPAMPLDDVIEAIAEANKRVDFVVVSFHWGVEYSPDASHAQRVLAHRAVDAGADLILGHHPHVIQGLELYRDRLIAYSLGDFVFDHYSRPTGEAFVLRVTMNRSGPPSFVVVPVYLSQESGVPAIVSGEEADIILDRLIRLSAELDLQIVKSGDRAYYGSETIIQ